MPCLRKGLSTVSSFSGRPEANFRVIFPEYRNNSRYLLTYLQLLIIQKIIRDLLTVKPCAQSNKRLYMLRLYSVLISKNKCYSGIN